MIAISETLTHLNNYFTSINIARNQ